MAKVLGIVLCFVWGAGSQIWADAVVKIDGSSTVYPITEAVAEDFQKATGTKVTVGISGTGGGFKKFTRGRRMFRMRVARSRRRKSRQRKKVASSTLNCRLPMMP